MDESLLHFQDKKIVNTGPKSVKATVVKKKKGRKPDKRQKDIRTLVKSGKGALLSYATEFDNVCKQSGVDVDSEQLQLAIALSKSIQEQDVAYVKDCQELKETTSRGITKAMRITLKEYGFKSEKLRNTVSINKRKRYRKKYKLLLITDTARQQVISDKYAEVLLRNECESNCKTQFDNLSNELYLKTTNILYEYIKNDDLFYCTNIFQKSLHKSYMLKDWSDIPGRISSPKREVINFNLDSVEFSQNELDCILSGSVKIAQEIVIKKIDQSKENMEGLEITAENDPKSKTSNPIKVIDVERSSSVELCVMDKSSNKDNLLDLNSETPSSLSTPLPIRSISPDLFDDDDDDKPSTIDQSKDDVQVIDSIDKTKYDNTNYMDLTECVVPANINIHKDTQASSLQLKENKKFHDTMELTDCVQTNIKHASESIDLTQNLDEKENGTVHPQLEKCVETMDLTQSSDSNDDLPIVQISGKEIKTENKNKLRNGISSLKHTLESQVNTIGNSSLDNEENEQLSDKYSNENIDKNMVTDIYVEDSDCEHNNFLVHHTINIESDTSTLNLTQNVNSSHDALENTSIKIVNTKIMNESNDLGKINEISIDYDELFDSVNARNELSKNVSAMSEENQKIMETSDITEIFDSPDENPNISIQTAQNCDFGGISVMDAVSNLEITSKNSAENDASNKSGANNTGSQKNSDKINATPLRTKRKSTIETPKNNEYIIKTSNITPMLDYESMSSPERNKELDKYGIKPFKRKRAIQLLTHIYNQTHPIVEQCSSEELSPAKAQKRNFDNSPQTSHSLSPRKTKAVKTIALNKENIYQESKECPDIRNIQCNAEDWIFQKRETTKEHSCRVPLHIAFHNYVSCRKLLGEAILCYEPVNIDIIHKDLVGYGYRYNPKDLLKFLDKKCITVKTMDSTKTKKL